MVAPAAKETCGNGSDDDCKGGVDDGCVRNNCGGWGAITDLGLHCVVSQGSCSYPGTYVCNPGNPDSPICQGVPPAEVCDGKDNNCDGQTDPGCMMNACRGWTELNAAKDALCLTPKGLCNVTGRYACDGTESLVCSSHQGCLTVGVASGPRHTGDSHTCALYNDGTVQCWGKNAYGQLGNGTTLDSDLPVNVVMLPGRATSFYTGLSGPNSTCVVIGTSDAYCWGLGYSITQPGRWTAIPERGGIGGGPRTWDECPQHPTHPACTGDVP